MKNIIDSLRNMLGEGRAVLTNYYGEKRVNYWVDNINTLKDAVNMIVRMTRII